MPRACVPLAEGFEEIEAITIVDVLRRAEVEVVVAGVSGLTVRGAHAITITADRLLAEVSDQRWDAVVLPGGLPGAKHLRDDPGVQRLLRRQNAARGLIGAICAAPIALSKAGLLMGKAATSFPGFEGQLECREYREERVVVDANVVTSRGPGTALYFALELVRELGLADTAARLEHGMLVPRGAGARTSTGAWRARSTGSRRAGRRRLRPKGQGTA
jgi:4-methyl-5(b-hydroxyethyl)-thiazole monophosphate biosynthesis